MTTLGEFAFNNCHELTSVTIPSSVGEIGKGAFYGCPLTRVTAMGEDPPRLRAAAFGLPSRFEGTIRVPRSSVNSYKAEDGWRDYADRIGPIGGSGSGLIILFR